MDSLQIHLQESLSPTPLNAPNRLCTDAFSHSARELATLLARLPNTKVTSSATFIALVHMAAEAVLVYFRVAAE
jgi:hypothetical protein